MTLSTTLDITQIITTTLVLPDATTTTETTLGTLSTNLSSLATNTLSTVLQTGLQGDKGSDGDSAYVVWLSLGNSGTEQDFLDTLISTVPGPTGPQGIQGLQGIQGNQGLQGTQGVKGDTGPIGDTGSKGDNGNDGLSAYEVAVNNGYVGDEASWLASLVGEQGIQGTQGLQGLKGDTGSQGTQGIQGVAGYTPIKGVDYFDGAKGDKGDTGATGVQGDPGTTDYNNLSNKPNIPDQLSDLSDDTTHRLVTDTEKSTWDGKQNALGFTPVPDSRTVAGKALTSNITLAKGDVGLDQVDNTSDANKAVSTATQTALNSKEPAITKNTAFNKNFGTTAGTVTEGNDSRLSDARTPTAHTHTINDVINLQTTLNGKVGEAPVDGKKYVRKDSGWVEDVAVAGTQQVFVQTTAPSVVAGTQYIWFQTGLGAGNDMTLWVEDGL